MTTEGRNVPAREQRVDEAIAAYLSAVDAGHAPDPDDFIAQHGDIASDLRSFFANRDQLRQWAELLEGRGSRVEGLGPEDLEHSVFSGSRLSTLDSRPGEPTSASVVEEAHEGSHRQRFGDYELLEEVARGGMGVVYKARQVSLRRIVALKMILAGQLASSEDVKRFRAEAEAAANLDHPGIVPVYDVGVHNGQHYFSMGYVHGCSLAGLLRDGPLPSRAAAELLTHVCEAVQYAHEQGVIHRDLKPANILLEGRGSRVEGLGPEDLEHSVFSGSRLSTLDSRPKITDFGLAKRLQGDAELTHSGQLLGTPSYMSPEQATAGASHPIGPASDIYALGAVLYQMLTGRPPFQAETALETLSQVLDSDPVPPRLLNRNVSRELEAICMKCLAKKPADRYGSARDLADELQRHLHGECIHASGINLLDRVSRALRPNQHEEHFREWGLGLIAFGLVIFFSHIAIFFCEGMWQQPIVAYFLPRSVMFASLLFMLARFRRYSLLPMNSAERLVWVVWIGYVLALGASNAARAVLGHDQRESYSSFAVLAGFGFFIMGGHAWGGGYIVGLVFLIAAPIMAAYSSVASIASGTLWAGALLTFGYHYYRRGRAAIGQKRG